MHSTRARRLFAVLAALSLSLPGVAQPAPLQNRPSAGLADPEQAWWFYRPQRVESEKPEELLDILGIKEGDVVADIGAGPGFFSLRAARRVGPTGKVLAVDVQQEMIDGLQRMASQFAPGNIVPILGDVDNPRLAGNSVNVVLVVLAYHEFSHPVDMMRHIYDAMTRDARLLLVEYKAEDTSSQVDRAHRMSEIEILSEMSALGFSRVKVVDMIPAQHDFVFAKDDRLH